MKIHFKIFLWKAIWNFLVRLTVFLKHFFGFLKTNFVIKKFKSDFYPIEAYFLQIFFASMDFFLNWEFFFTPCWYILKWICTIFLKFDKGVTKVEDADAIRSLNGMYFSLEDILVGRVAQSCDRWLV